MRVVWVPRSAWGSRASTESFIKARVSDPAYKKTEIHIHHSAAIDNDDDTPNRWDYDEAVAYVKKLEWVRPDLGPLPYSECFAVSEDLQTVWVFQGRGWTKRGAHTGGHNVAGVGLVAFGNFNKSDPLAANAILEAMERRVQAQMLPNLGSKKSPNGWNAWGHRDSKSTSCPGSSLYPQIADFSLQGEDMAHPAKSFGEFVKRHGIGNVPSWSPWDEYFKAGGSTLKSSGTWAFTRADIAWFWKKFIKPLQDARKIHRGRLDNHRGRLDSQSKLINSHILFLRELEDDIAGLQQQVDGLEVPSSTIDMTARRAADEALARLNNYNLHL